MNLFRSLWCLPLLFFSCKTAQTGKKQDLLTVIYSNQQNYLRQHTSPSTAYETILKLGLRNRKELYKKEGIDVSTFDEFTILEGYSEGWGKYTGMLLNNVKSYYYIADIKNKPSIHPLPDNANTKLTAGLSPEIIDMVKRWDTTAILKASRAFGAGVLDGMDFIATKVSYDTQRNPKIETITFREFVP